MMSIMPVAVIPAELVEIIELTQAVKTENILMIIEAAKKLHEFREEKLGDETFHDLKYKMEQMELSIQNLITLHNDHYSIIMALRERINDIEFEMESRDQ